MGNFMRLKAIFISLLFVAMSAASADAGVFRRNG